MPKFTFAMPIILIGVFIGCSESPRTVVQATSTTDHDVMSISVTQYDSDNVPNPNPNGETPFEKFWRVRSTVFAATQKHGETGPESRSNSPRYWLVDDQYNDELYQNMQVYEPEGWTKEWLTDLITGLREHKGWAISIGHIDQGHLLVFADRIMVTGPTFEQCDDLQSVVDAAKLAAANFEERKNGPLSRQLQYIETLLPAAMKDADANTFCHLATFDGYQLHEGNAIWIFQKPNDEELTLDTDYAPVRMTAVSADGTIHPEFCKAFWPATNVSPPYWLLAYIVKDRAKINFKMIDEDDNEVGTVAIGRVITDTQLKERSK